MKYCTKCGNELMDEAIICMKCGCAVEKSPKEKIKKNTSVNSNESKTTDMSWTPLAFVILACCGFLPIGCVHWNFVSIFATFSVITGIKYFKVRKVFSLIGVICGGLWWVFMIVMFIA